MRVVSTGGVAGKIASHPSAILLVVQLLGVLVYPFMETGGVGALLFEVFGALVLALAIWATRESPGPTWIAVTLAVLASGLSIADEINPIPAMDVASGVLHAIFYFWAAGSLMVYMLADRSWLELLFLSFTNLSSTGLSDVVPVTGQSRAVVMIEQVAGLGYVALFVSRLVGLTIAWQMIPSRDPRRTGDN